MCVWVDMCLCVRQCVYLCMFVQLRETCGYAKPQCKGTTQQVMHCILMVVPFRIPTCSLCVSSAQPARALGTNSTLLNSLKSPMRILGNSPKSLRTHWRWSHWIPITVPQRVTLLGLWTWGHSKMAAVYISLGKGWWRLSSLFYIFLLTRPSMDSCRISSLCSHPTSLTILS